jgi:hypothetical protein
MRLLRCVIVPARLLAPGADLTLFSLTPHQLRRPAFRSEESGGVLAVGAEHPGVVARETHPAYRARGACPEGSRAG